ncbi:MAG: hydrogenase maturation nickel metallochaperone HypA [DPANN group archaeon]|nr:hydrogenase maturation nickel metallochaperone HypA [DPANN group archaeon]
MHEFSAVQQTIDELEKNKRDIKVLLGCMKADKDVFLNTLKEMLKGTPLETLKIEVEEIKATGQCACGFKGEIDVPGHIHFLRCPQCREVCKIIKGNDINIENL